MLAIAKFKQQDWVKFLSQDSGTQQPKKMHVNTNVTFPFQDDFSVGTIHGTNMKTTTQETAAAPTATEVVEIQDNNDNISVLTLKTTSKGHPNVTVGSRVASGSNPVSGPTAAFPQSGTASGGSKDPASAGPTGGDSGGPDSK